MSVSILQALDLIYQNIKPVSTQMIPLESALGYVIAEDITATHNLPPYDNSAMDGYAVSCGDAGKSMEISHTIYAGDKDEIVLNPGYLYKIMTGAKIPFGCEAVVPFEEVTLLADTLTLPSSIEHGQHIRLAGEDINKDDLLLSKGDLLDAYQITLLASQGISHLLVYEKPKVAVFASGSELRMHFQTLSSHQIYNTNTPMLLARAQALGSQTTFINTAIDDVDAICHLIQNSLHSDLIITSGGASVGDADFTRAAFERFDFEVIFDKVEIKPGKPTTFGKIGDTYVLNLPGNPLAAALCFELFAKTAIFAMSGQTKKFLNYILVKNKQEYRVNSKRNTLLPGYFDGSSFLVSQKHSPGMIMPLATSNGFIIVGKDVDTLQAGQDVKFLPMTFDFTSKTIVDLMTI